MKGELYEYQGEMLSQAEIARRTGINRTTLDDWYKRTGNMEAAVETAKKSLAQRNIQYYDEVLSLKAIALKENIKFESLKKNYDTLGDIYEAVKETKIAQQKRQGDILYKGRMMTAPAIANEEDLDVKALRRNILKTNDIEEAVRLTKEARDRHRGTIEYKGRIMSISGIANELGLKHDSLQRNYESCGNIEKAIMITKLSKLKQQQITLRGRTGTIGQISNNLGLSAITVGKWIAKGWSPNDIERKKTGRKKEEQLQYDDNSLYRYCLDHSYNYWVIKHMIDNYGRTPEEAVKVYELRGQQIPTRWIYEKYGVLFKHLMLKYGLDSNRIIKIMKENCCGIEDAVQDYIFAIKNNNSGFRQVEIDWLRELYPFLKEITPEEFEEAKKEFYITDKELQFLKEKDEKIEDVKRQLLLFEFSEVLDIWPQDEILTMLDLYNITPEEKNIIILDLYAPFKNGVIDINKKNYIDELNKMVLDPSITVDSLSGLEKIYVERKRKKISELYPSNVQDDNKPIL